MPRLREAGAWLALLAAAGAAGAGPAIFSEIAAASGVEFVHFNGMTGEWYFPENVGAGVALLDYDGDGDLDLYLRQGVLLDPAASAADALFPPPPGSPPGDRLYRNEGSWRFVDVTAASGIEARSYAMGVATADFDNDGWTDLYLTNFGANQLWRNRGDGTFADVTAAAGVAVGLWSVSASFFDYDRDGWLDLYVGNYVDFTLQNHKPCYTSTSARDYCGPRSFQPQPDRLFRNRGDGTFEDVTAGSGIGAESGGALGVIAADFDQDGWTDVYVANDQLPNQLWINQRNGRFVNDAVLAGVAVNMDGAPEASMGVDAADFDGDGDEDIFITHLSRQTNTLYVNEGNGWFRDRTLSVGLAAASFPFTSFGTAWFDYDNDGLLDLLIANGAVQTIEELALAGDPYPLHQPNQLFRNLGGARFEDATAAAGPAFGLSEVSRGAAFGDLDRDGDTDVAITNNNGPVRLLRNEVGSAAAWLGVELEPASAAVGARAAVGTAPPRWRRVRTDGSYASANEPGLLFGVGDERQPADLLIVWPDASRSLQRRLPLRRYLRLRRPPAAAVGGDGGGG